jgi:alpha-L-rhamnosidase
MKSFNSLFKLPKPMRTTKQSFLMLFIVVLLISPFQGKGLSKILSSNNFEVSELKCEYFKNPITISEARPRLSWEFKSLNPKTRNLKQSAYQILVATSQELLDKGIGDMWNSGKVLSDRNIQVSYSGQPLKSRKLYFWKVRVWDNNNQVSDWSPASVWRMAILNTDEWQAQWITIPESFWTETLRQDPEKVEVGQWLWCNDINRIYLRKTFVLDNINDIVKALIRIEADNRFDVWINGKAILIPEQTDWRKTPEQDIRRLLQPGENIVNIRALNTDTPLWFMSAIRAGLEMNYAAGANGKPARTETILSDKTWMMTRITWPKVFMPYGGGFKEEEWLKPGFTDIELPDICQSLHPRLTRRSWYARHEFNLESKPVSAQVYVTAHGLYELRLNGRKVGNDLLTPDYMKHVRLYQVYDVTDALTDGQNCLAALVGSGWLNSYGHSTLTSDKPLFFAQMHIKYANGVSEIVATNENWKTHPSPLLEDSPQYGERYDSQLEQAGWDQPGFDDAEWKQAKKTEAPVLPLIPQQHEPVRITAEKAAKAISEPIPGVFVCDFVQNASGRIRLRISGAKPGQKVVIRYGETLKTDGTVQTFVYDNVVYSNQPNERFMMRNIDTYICRGDNEEFFEPRFAYTGFRYVQISGYPGIPNKGDVVQRIFHTDTPVVGKFECSDTLLNQIWRNSMWSWRSNIHGFPTDCPTREKHPWEDVGVQVAQTACWFMNSEQFLENWLKNGYRMGGTVGWKDMTITMPWLLYTFYNDSVLLKTQYNSMKALVDERTRAANGGLFTGASFEWLDHIAIEKTDKEIFCSSFYYHNVDVLIQTARLLGRSDDVLRYQDMLREIRNSINERFLDTEKNLYRNNTQTAQLLPLAFGIAPDSLRAAIARSLVEDIIKHDYHLTTGMTGTKFLLPVLTSEGYLEVACRLATQTTYPSWGYWINHDATTILETWNAIPETGADQKNSHNHPNLGSIGEWFFEYLAGIKPDQDHPGFKHFIIKPFIPGNLAWAGADYHSMYGLIRSHWKKQGDKFILEVKIPANTTATVYVPTYIAEGVTESDVLAAESKGVTFLGIQPGYVVYQVASGDYRFEAPK